MRQRSFGQGGLGACEKGMFELRPGGEGEHLGRSEGRALWIEVTASAKVLRWD